MAYVLVGRTDLARVGGGKDAIQRNQVYVGTTVSPLVVDMGAEVCSAKVQQAGISAIDEYFSLLYIAVI